MAKKIEEQPFYIPPERKGGLCNNPQCDNVVPDYQGVHHSNAYGKYHVYCDYECFLVYLRRKE